MSQCLERLKEIHDKGIIHRDMKPENLVIGNKGKEKNIYLIDFGLSKIIASDKKSNILFIKKEKIVVGTLRYISINAHLGNEQYKKDDLESLAYIMIYFIKGELPWQNMKSKTRKEKYSKIYQMKKKMVPNELCNFLPEEMKTFLNYIVSLNAKAKPDYAKLINLINNLMKKYSYCNDLQFDWCSPLFLKMIYNKPAVDDGEKKKSSSIYEEDSSNSGNNIKKIKTNRYATSSSKKNKLNNNFNNKIKTLKAIKITSVKNIKDFYRQNAFSPGNIKTSLNIDTNKNEKVKNDYKKLAISMNNYLNNDSFNRERLSSY
jgi:serine/threonine protein kinase